MSCHIFSTTLNFLSFFLTFYNKFTIVLNSSCQFIQNVLYRCAFNYGCICVLRMCMLNLYWYLLHLLFIQIDIMHTCILYIQYTRITNSICYITLHIQHLWMTSKPKTRQVEIYLLLVFFFFCIESKEKN